MSTCVPNRPYLTEWVCGARGFQSGYLVRDNLLHQDKAKEKWGKSSTIQASNDDARAMHERVSLSAFWRWDYQPGQNNLDLRREIFSRRDYKSRATIPINYSDQWQVFRLHRGCIGKSSINAQQCWYIINLVSGRCSAPSWVCFSYNENPPLRWNVVKVSRVKLQNMFSYKVLKF